MEVGGKLFLAVTGAALCATAPTVSAEELTIATVNNADMIVMQKLSSRWEDETGHTIDWVVLEENVLRQRVTTDIATQGGQYDVMTIGSYETPIWGKQGWLAPVDDLGEDYDYDDILPALRKGLSHDGTLYAVPFYGESSFTMYRTDLFEEAGLEMPEQPTYEQIMAFAAALTDKSKERYGICLRGKPGLGRERSLLLNAGEHLRRALVRHGLAAPTQYSALEGRVELLLDHLERIRPAGRVVQWLQRESSAVPNRQVRHVDRRHGSRR